MKKHNHLLTISIFFFGVLLSSCTGIGSPEYRGASYEIPAPPPDFTLPSTQGGEFTLSEQTGKVVLLFFGYTYCPDICPAALGTLKAALNQLSQEEQQKVIVVFITIDPERDTLDHLKPYMENFNAGFIGLVPTLDQLQTLKGQYQIVAEKEEIQPDGSYLMAHSSVIYGINLEGNLQLGFFSEMTSEDIAHDVHLLLKQ